MSLLRKASLNLSFSCQKSSLEAPAALMSAVLKESLMVPEATAWFQARFSSDVEKR